MRAGPGLIITRHKVAGALRRQALVAHSIALLLLVTLPAFADVRHFQVRDSGNYRLTRYDAEGRTLASYSGFGAVRDIALYDDSTILVAEHGANRVTAFALGGQVLWEHKVHRPQCVSRLDSNRILVCQQTPPKLFEIDTAGDVLWQLKIDLKELGGAAKLPDGRVVVAGMRDRGVVELLSGDGQAVWSTTDRIRTPQGVEVLSNGQIAVANFNLGTITLLRPETPDRSDIPFCCHARQISETAAGNLVTTSAEKQRVAIWTPNGRRVSDFDTKYPPVDAVELADGSLIVAEHTIPDRTCLYVGERIENPPASAMMHWLGVGLLAGLLLAGLFQWPVLRSWLTRRWEWEVSELEEASPVDASERRFGHRMEIAAYLVGLGVCIAGAIYSPIAAPTLQEVWPLPAFLLAGGLFLAALQIRTPGEDGIWSKGMAAMSPMSAASGRMKITWLAATAATAGAFLGVYMEVYTWEPALWLASIVLFALGSIEMPQRKKLAINPWKVAAALVLATVLAYLRFVDLAVWPQKVHQDMAQWGMQAMRLWEGEDSKLFSNGWAKIPALGYLWSTVFVGLSDEPLYGARAAAAVGSLLAILGTGLMTTRLAGTAAGFTATVLLGANQTFFHFSRIQAYMDPVPFGVLALFFLLRGLEVGRFVWFALAGLSGGYAAVGYFSGRITPIAMIVVTALIIARYPRVLIRRWRGLLLCGVSAFAMIGPLGLVYFLGRADALGRVDQYPWRAGGEIQWEVLWQTLANGIPRVFGSFWFFRDSSTQYGGSAQLFPISAALLGISTTAALLRCWDLRALIPVVWASLIFLIGGVLTTDPPFYPRLVLVMAPVCILIALSVAPLMRGLRFSAGRGGLWLSVLLICGLMAFDARDQIESYWRFSHGISKTGQAPSRPIQTTQSLLGRDLLQWGAETRIYFVARNPLEHSCWQSIIRFFAYNLDSSDARDITDYIPFKDSRRIVAYFKREDEAEAVALKAIYPSAEISKVTDNIGGFPYYRVVVPPQGERGAAIL